MKKLNKKIVVTASFLAAITILLGAFGAHGLKQLVSTEAITTFETGVRYQMYHCLALLVIGFVTVIPKKSLLWTFRFFLFGILLFSGSIYLLALKDVLPFNVGWLGPITPIGGLFFIVGWIRLAIGLLTLKQDN
ncbi:DUF423 domain-containing protein [Jejudonia soesokkakensis]|uniref:DUF423 domain-containing protein n=1 Tax=Jejudonia soesokkakensis TaxID=1323432 RepID=A0ABW2MU91_9FLAO